MAWICAEDDEIGVHAWRYPTALVGLFQTRCRGGGERGKHVQGAKPCRRHQDVLVSRIVHGEEAYVGAEEHLATGSRKRPHTVEDFPKKAVSVEEHERRNDGHPAGNHLLGVVGFPATTVFHGVRQDIDTGGESNLKALGGRGMSVDELSRSCAAATAAVAMSRSIGLVLPRPIQETTKSFSASAPASIFRCTSCIASAAWAGVRSRARSVGVMTSRR